MLLLQPRAATTTMASVLHMLLLQPRAATTTMATLTLTGDDIYVGIDKLTLMMTANDDYHTTRLHNYTTMLLY